MLLCLVTLSCFFRVLLCHVILCQVNSVGSLSRAILSCYFVLSLYHASFVYYFVMLYCVGLILLVHFLVPFYHVTLSCHFIMLLSCITLSCYCVMLMLLSHFVRFCNVSYKDESTDHYFSSIAFSSRLHLTRVFCPQWKRHRQRKK